VRVIVVSNTVLHSAHTFAFPVAALSLCLGAAVACSSAPSALFSTSGVVNAEQPAAGGSGSAGAELTSGGAAGGTTGHGGSSSTSNAGRGAGGDPATGGETDAAGSPAGGAPAAGAPAAGAPSAGGTAGAGTVNAPSVCDAKLVVPGALIADFEDSVATWSGYVGDNPLAVESTQPGADMTEHALRFKGGKASTSGVFHLMPCSDVSAFDGVQFWAKGKGGDMVRFLAVIPGTDPTPGVGDCDSNAGKCSDHPGKLFTFGPEWGLYRASFAELKQYGWGIKASFNSVLNAVLWINDGPVDDFDFAIDEVALYKAATTQ
jgi:hypothetical protein